MNADKQTLLPNWVLWPSRFLLFATVIFISQQMLTDNPVDLSPVSVWDKFLHFSAWGLVVILGYCSYRSQRHFIMAAIAVFIYSTFIEILQPLVAQRFFSLGDIVANGLGCFIAALLAPRIDKWLATYINK